MPPCVGLAKIASRVLRCLVFTDEMLAVIAITHNHNLAGIDTAGGNIVWFHHQGWRLSQ
jgi:hypothetical protein